MSVITLSHADEMQEQERINRAESVDAALGALRAITQRARAKDEVAEFAYQQVRDSPLWDTLPNSVIDTKAEELAAVIEQTLNEWFRKQSHVSFPVEHPHLRSLSEAQEGEDSGLRA